MEQAHHAEPAPTRASNGIAAVPPAGGKSMLARFEPFLYLLPAVLVFTLFLAVPVAGTIVISLSEWNGVALDTATFIGVDNYVDAFNDSAFLSLIHISEPTRPY